MKYYLVYPNESEVEEAISVIAESSEEAIEIAIWQHYIESEDFFKYIDSRCEHISIYSRFNNSYTIAGFLLVIDEEEYMQTMEKRILKFFNGNQEWTGLLMNHLKNEDLKANDFPKEMRYYICKNDYLYEPLLPREIIFITNRSDSTKNQNTIKYYLVYPNESEVEKAIPVIAESSEEAIEIAIWEYYIESGDFLRYIDRRCGYNSIYYRFQKSYFIGGCLLVSDHEEYNQTMEKHIFEFFNGNQEWASLLMNHLNNEDLKAKDFPKEMRYYMCKQDYLYKPMLARDITFIKGESSLSFE